MNKNIIPIEEYLHIIEMKDILYTEHIDNETNLNKIKNPNKIMLTKNHIKLSKRENGWFKPQLELLNISFPPPKGWKKDCIGNLYSKEVIEQFINYQHKENKIEDYFTNIQKE